MFTDLVLVTVKFWSERRNWQLQKLLHQFFWETTHSFIRSLVRSFIQIHSVVFAWPIWSHQDCSPLRHGHRARCLCLVISKVHLFDDHQGSSCDSRHWVVACRKTLSGAIRSPGKQTTLPYARKWNRRTLSASRLHWILSMENATWVT